MQVFLLSAKVILYDYTIRVIYENKRKCVFMKKKAPPYSLATNKVFCNFCPAFCCYRLEGSSLLIDASDINRIARHLNITDGDVRKQYVEEKNTFKVREDGSCIFLSNGKISKRCSIHRARPRQCQEFPYDKPCPYLESEELLYMIQPKVAKSCSCSE